MEQKKITLAMGAVDDREAIHHTCMRSYSSYQSVLSPEDWDKMRHNIEDKIAFEKLYAMAVPFICRVEGQIAGVVFLVPEGNATPYFSGAWSYIRMLGVLEEYRGMGIARLLMQRCIDHARNCGAGTLALHTSGFQKAWRIYEQLGFQRVKDIGVIYGHTYWLYQLSFKRDEAIAPETMHNKM